MQVSNNSNLSFKAYFKVNAKFNTIYGSADKSTITNELMAKLKNLPDHELEIVNTARKEMTNKQFGQEYTIFNNRTKKAISTTVPYIQTALADLINYLNSFHSVDFFKEDEGNTTDYLTLTMPRSFK